MPPACLQHPAARSKPSVEIPTCPIISNQRHFSTILMTTSAAAWKHLYAAELTKLAPVTAKCRPVPVQPFADLAGVFDKPVRPTIAARVAGHVASL
jgi:hypothetical protein